MTDNTIHSLLSANFNTLYNLSQKQFSQSLGLHLNSSDWRAYVKPGQAKFYNFLLTGIVKTNTHTSTDDMDYEQIIQFSEYKRLENSIMLLFMNEVPDKDIVNFVATFLFNTRTKVFCTCPAFKFWGFEYILTRKKSVYGPGEYRYPVINNPDKHGVFCKHLWMVAESMQKKQLRFAEGLVPFYKRAFGIDTKKKFDKYKRESGILFVKQLFEDSKEDVDFLKNAKIRKNFENISKNYFTSTGRKKYKKPEVLDQKEDNTEEVKEEALNNKSIIRKPEESEVLENEKTVLDEMDEAIDKEALGVD